MFAVRSAYGALGVMLALIALYLVLVWGANAARVVDAVGANGAVIFKTLQGR